MRALKITAIVVISVILLVLIGGTSWYFWKQAETDSAQEALEPFYTPPDPITGTPGDVIRSEPAPEWDVPGGTATRVLFVTENQDGAPRVSGGTIWVPDRSASGPREVVAWAHGTIGLGDQCAPSRSTASLPLMSGWVAQMMANGWVVTAPDYQGLGTDEPHTYLLGRDEARDVVNSVRAARNLSGAQAGRRWGVYGHSQGGHAALWTGQLARELAPELRLVGVAAAAPAADLEVIMDQQWDQLVAWAIGPEVVVSWPNVYPDLPIDEVVSSDGQSATQSQADDCIMTAAAFGLLRQKFGQQYFASNPLDNPAWVKAVAEQTPAPPDPDLPVLIPVGTQDNVVLPGSIAYLQEQYCAAGADLTMDWLGGVQHIEAAQVAGPEVVSWLDDRFQGRPTEPDCAQKPPVPPYDPATAG